MGVESDTDRAGFFDLADFGVAATFTPSGGDPVSVNGIFDNEFAAALNGFEVEVESRSPGFMCRASDVLVVAHGDALVIEGVGYTVTGIEPDGQGMILLALSRSA